jgi:hypothetical protein
MCEIDGMLALVIAAEAAMIAATVLLTIAIFTSSNPWTSLGSPALLTAAFILVAVALVSLGIAIGLQATCPCRPNDMLLSLAGLTAALCATEAAIAVAIAPSAIPFLGSVVVTVIVVSAIAQMVLLMALYSALAALVACNPTASTTTTGTLLDIVYGLAVVFLIGVVVLAVVTGIKLRKVRQQEGPDDQG